MTEPIKPDEVSIHQADSLPDEVIEAWNAAIVKRWDGIEARVSVMDVAFEISEKMHLQTEIVVTKGYTRVESIYRGQGWKVEREDGRDTFDCRDYLRFTK